MSVPETSMSNDSSSLSSVVLPCGRFPRAFSLILLPLLLSFLFLSFPPRVLFLFLLVEAAASAVSESSSRPRRAVVRMFG